MDMERLPWLECNSYAKARWYLVLSCLYQMPAKKRFPRNALSPSLEESGRTGAGGSALSQAEALFWNCAETISASQVILQICGDIPQIYQTAQERSGPGGILGVATQYCRWKGFGTRDTAGRGTGTWMCNNSARLANVGIGRRKKTRENNEIKVLSRSRLASLILLMRFLLLRPRSVGKLARNNLRRERLCLRRTFCCFFSRGGMLPGGNRRPIISVAIDDSSLKGVMRAGGQRARDSAPFEISLQLRSDRKRAYSAYFAPFFATFCQQFLLQTPYAPLTSASRWQNRFLLFHKNAIILSKGRSTS